MGVTLLVAVMAPRTGKII